MAHTGRKEKRMGKITVELEDGSGCTEMTYGRQLWIARDESWSAGYELFAGKPRLMEEESFFSPGTMKYYEAGRAKGNRSLDLIFCAADFEKFSGLKLRPGECRKIRIHMELV
jgi:hypothetical protein